MRALVKNIYKSAHEAKANGQKVAYIMVASQYDEILRAMDIVPLPTENYAGLCAAKRDMDRFLLKAEADGYSQVLCSYARIGLGFDSLRKDLGRIPDNSPDGGMPVPGHDAGKLRRVRSALQMVSGNQPLSGGAHLRHRCGRAAASRRT